MAIALDKQGQRIYFTGDTFAVKDRIKSIGGKWDGDRRAWWIGSAKADAAQQLIASLGNDNAADNGQPQERAKQNPDDIRLTGKGEYKGRSYFVGSATRDGTRVRLLTLPDANGEFLDFWADRSLVTMTKTYQPRERWNGRRGGGTVTVYTTLGSIAHFIAKSRREEAQIKAGEVPDGYCVDLEDGCLKRRGECDMPSD